MTRNKTNTLYVTSSCATIMNPPSPLVRLGEEGAEHVPRLTARDGSPAVGFEIGGVIDARCRSFVFEEGSIFVRGLRQSPV